MPRLRAFLGVLLLLALTRAGAEEIHFYLGTYTGASGSKGIYQGELDTDTGRLGPITLAAVIANPSFLALAPDGKSLYAALEEWNAAGMAAFARGADGALTPIRTARSTSHLIRMGTICSPPITTAVAWLVFSSPETGLCRRKQRL